MASQIQRLQQEAASLRAEKVELQQRLVAGNSAMQVPHPEYFFTYNSRNSRSSPLLVFDLSLTMLYTSAAL